MKITTTAAEPTNKAARRRRNILADRWFKRYGIPSHPGFATKNAHKHLADARRRYARSPR